MPTGTRTAVAWGQWIGATGFIDGEGTYLLEAWWQGEGERSGTIYALQWNTRESGAPAAFTGHGEAAATLTPGGEHEVAIALAPPAQTAQLTGTIVPPEGMPTPAVVLTQQLGANYYQLWSAQTTTFEATIPLVPAGRSTIFASTSGQGGAFSHVVHPGLAGDTDVSFEMLPPPVLEQPEDGALDVDVTTPFSVTSAAPAVCTFLIVAGGASYEVITAASEITIPAVVEVPLPPRELSYWSVHCTGPLEATDELAVDGPAQPVWPGAFSGPRLYWIGSSTRSFTTYVPNGVR